MMSDEELDRDWKPSGRRPQSTIARSFSQELMDIFRIENSVADLDEKVDKRLNKRVTARQRLDSRSLRRPHTPVKSIQASKSTDEYAACRKHNVQTQATELEALEARIKEMEERLKRQSMPGGSSSPRTQRPPVSGAFGEPSDAPPQVPEKDNRRPTSSRTLQQESKHGSRPGTARASQQAVPGALPPTPTASEGEYEFEFVDIPSDGGGGGGGGGGIRGDRQERPNMKSKPNDHHQHPHIPVPQRRRPLRGDLQTTTTTTSSNTLLPEDPHQNTGSESESCADFVIVSGADGDGQRDS